MSDLKMPTPAPDGEIGLRNPMSRRVACGVAGVSATVIADVREGDSWRRTSLRADAPILVELDGSTLRCVFQLAETFDGVIVAFLLFLDAVVVEHDYETPLVVSSTEQFCLDCTISLRGLKMGALE